jgi:hypothetical protein
MNNICNYLGGCGRREKKFHFFSLLPHLGVFFEEKLKILNPLKNIRQLGHTPA